MTLCLVGAPLLLQGVAQAYAKGTCFVLQQGQSQKIRQCTKADKAAIKAAGLTYNDNKCYSITGSTSGATASTTDCSGKGKAGTSVNGSANSGGSGNSLGACDSNAGFTADPAVCSPPCKTANNCNLYKKYINPIINKFLAPMAILAVVIGLIWGGILYTTAGGDPQQVANAKSKIQKALIGLVAFMFLYAFLQWLIPGGLL